MGREKRHKATLNTSSQETSASRLDAIIEESRSLRRQMADDLSSEIRNFRRMSRHFGRGRRTTDPDEQSA